VVSKQSDKEKYLHIKPRPRVEKRKNRHVIKHHKKPRNQHDNECRHGDDVPKAASHEDVLLPKYLFFRLLKLVGVFIINENPHKIEDSGEVTHHENYVQGFEDKISHKIKIFAKILAKI
jgi:hypothetical protein